MEYEIWGMYPPPIGGVSIHIKRLIGALNEIGRVTLKDFKPKDVYTVDFVKPVKNPLKELFILLFSSKRVIHIEQFSYLLFVCLLIFAGRHHYGITIHNQRSVAIRSKLKILLCRIFFKKCSFIIMNDKLFSEKFANKFDVDLQKIHILPAFLPPLLSEQKGLPRYVKDFKLKHDLVLSANAYRLRKDNGVDVYGMDMLVNLIYKLRRKSVNAGLLFLLPAIGDRNYYGEIKSMISNFGIEKDILIIEGECDNGFEYWGASDVFIRPTLTDMEGLSVKEALSSGVHVIASDVCVRPQECILFNNRNEEDLFDKVYDLYQSGIYKDKVTYNSSVDVAQATWNIYKSI